MPWWPTSQRRQLLRLRNRRVEYVFQALFARCHVGSEETGRLIRTALSSVSTSQTVWNAVRESGVQYVLLLDCGSGEGRTVS